MLFWLADLVAEAGGPALFRFSTTRVVLAFLTAFVVGLLLGRPMILWLYKHGWRSKERVYGDINTRSKSGTPIMGGALILGTFFNYVFGWKFSSSVVVLMALFAAIGLLFLCFVDRHWKFNPAENHFSRFDIYAAILLFLAAIVMTALAIAFSSRFNIIITLAACVGIFLLGLIIDYVYGQYGQTYVWARLVRYVIPNLQIFWISDAIYEGSPVPGRYIGTAASYAVCYTGAILAIAVGLFQRRQVG